jgi:hypothetical protein
VRFSRKIKISILAGSLAATASAAAVAGDHHQKARAYLVIDEPVREYRLVEAAPTRTYLVEPAPAGRQVEYRTVKAEASRAVESRSIDAAAFPRPEDFQFDGASKELVYKPRATPAPQAKSTPQVEAREATPVIRERVIEREVPVIRERVIEREVPVIRERVVVREVVPVRAYLVREHCRGWFRP